MKSKKRSFVICFLLVFINSSFSQITFQKTYGGAQDDGFNSVERTTDGGYIAVGYTNSFGAGLQDIYLVKTNASGDTLWTRTYGSIDNESGFEVQQTADSGYIIIGSTQNGSKAFLIKTDMNGDTLWTKTYKAGAFAAGYSVKQTIDGGYILSCTGGNDGTGFLIKTDAIGDTLWTKSYAINGDGNEIQQTADSGYIVIGTGDDGGGIYYLYLVKIDTNGNAVWKKAYRGNSPGDRHYGYSVQQTSDSGYIAVGYSDNSQVGVYLIKTNSLGDTLWTKGYGGNSGDGGFCIGITNDGGFIIAGGTASFGAGLSDVYIIKTDSIGDTLWTKSFGDSNYDDSHSIQQTSDAGYIIAGRSYSGLGGYDAYLIKTDSNGNSGCHENETATMVRAPSTIVSLPVDTFLLQPVLVNSYSALVSSGGMTNTVCTTVEINELGENNSMNIYPNPAQDKFTININTELVNTQMEIYDMFGKKIYSTNLQNNQEVINCKEFLSGIYFVTVKIRGQIITKKLIINI